MQTILSKNTREHILLQASSKRKQNNLEQVNDRSVGIDHTGPVLSGSPHRLSKLG